MNDNMSVREYMEYAQVYPYTKDAFQFEQAISRANLLATYLECYNDLLESDNISPVILEQLIVESVDDIKYIDKVEAAFIEAAGTSGGIVAKLCQWLGNFFTSAFRKITSGWDNLNANNSDIADTAHSMVNKIIAIGGSAAAAAGALAMVPVIGERINRFKDTIGDVKNEIDRLKQSGLSIEPEDSNENPIMQLNQQIADMMNGDAPIPPENARMIEALSNDSYRITCSAFIDELEQVIQIISSIIPYDANSRNEPERMVFDSYNKMVRNGTIKNAKAEFQKVTTQITAINKRPKTLHITKDWLDERLNAINNFKAIIDILGSVTNIPADQLKGASGRVINAVTTSDEQISNQEKLSSQWERERQADKERYNPGTNVITRKMYASKAEEMKANTHNDDYREFISFVNEAHAFVTTLQKIVSTRINELRLVLNLKGKAMTQSKNFLDIARGVIDYISNRGNDQGID